MNHVRDHSHALHFPRTRSAGVVSCTISDLDLVASAGDSTSYPILVGVCNGVYSAAFVLAICLLLLVGFPGTRMFVGMHTLWWHRQRFAHES